MTPSGGPRRLVVVGASAGGVEALSSMARAMVPGLPAAVLVVLHVLPDAGSQLPAILARAGPLSTVHPKDGERIEEGVIYVAPPDVHLLVQDGSIHLGRGPKENGHRPAIDPLFRSAARAYGPRVVGVILSGARDDGAAGLAAVKAGGGLAIVQDPNEALYPSMPAGAMRAVEPDHVAPAASIGSLVSSVIRSSLESGNGDPNPTERGHASLVGSVAKEEPPGTPSGFTCPDCGGVLWELRDDQLVRFRCRTGHAYSPDSLIALQAEATEAALWTALRALEEKASLRERLAEHLRERGATRSATRLESQMEETRREVKVVKELLATHGGASGSEANGEGGESPDRAVGEEAS